MPTFIISDAVREKLKVKHSVSEKEMLQCFENRCGVFLQDDREDHQTDPVTLWFVAQTNALRMLKIVFMFIDGNIHIKTAYEANKYEIQIYEQKGK
jgi:uncharacterized DUF497 family protein